jgi:signal transduction histidine kinase
MTGLAGQAGLLLRNARLTAELYQRLEELRASRQRLVAAQDEERRKLERNLHDGAQQQIVSLKIKLGMAKSIALDERADETAAALAQLVDDAGDAVETLRELAHGIYPPLLAAEGLATALRSQARKAVVDVEVIADGVGRYSEDVEATVYFCCLEALQNVAKYAEARSVTIELTDDGGALRFEVCDDGRGFDPAIVRRGAGLQNMQDRLDAVGGHLGLESTPGQGATLTGTIPAASKRAAPASR